MRRGKGFAGSFQSFTYLLTILFLAAVSLCCCAHLAWAATYYVAPGGDNQGKGTPDRPWATPAFGAKQLGPGDTLVIRAGQYVLRDFEQDMIVPSSGRDGAWVTIRGDEGARPVLVGAENLMAAISLSNVSYLRIENLEITSDRQRPFRDGINAWDQAEHIILKNLYIHHLDEFGLDLRDVDDLKLLDSQVEYCGFGALGGPAGDRGWRNVLIKNCTLSYSGHYYQGTPGPSPYDRPDGLGIEPSSGPVEISDTVVEHNRGDGLDSKASSTYIHSCIVAQNSCDGIKLWGNNSKVETCLVYDTGDGDYTASPWAGLVIGQVEEQDARFEIVNTDVVDNLKREGYPMYVQYGGGVPVSLKMRNCIVSHGHGPVYIGPSVNFTADHCLFFCPFGDVPIEVAGRKYTSAQVEAGELGPENLARNPLFASSGSGLMGYELGQGSPAVDAGDPKGAPAYDLLCRPRPSGPGYDIGALERPAVALESWGEPRREAGVNRTNEVPGNESASRSRDNPSPPGKPVRLIFVHHSTGENWLSDENGGLGLALLENNYFVSDTNYGWGPDGIGDRTDIGNWWEWFRGPESSRYLQALYAESGQNCAYSRLGERPGGNNEVILFKSCFPNSALQGGPDDPVPAIGTNPLRGQESGSEHHTLANAKGIYIDLLERFRASQDKLFVVVTAPPVSDAACSRNARAFNQWLVNEWLKGYPYRNVFVFDLYSVLTTNGGSPDVNDLGVEAGNHHRWWNGAALHRVESGHDVLAYPSAPGDDHPSRAGNQKATAELLPLLNVAYHRWRG